MSALPSRPPARRAVLAGAGALSLAAALLPLSAGPAGAAGPAPAPTPTPTQWARGAAPAAPVTVRSEQSAPASRSAAPSTTWTASTTAAAADAVTVVPGSPRPPVSLWEITAQGFDDATLASLRRAVDLWAGIVASPVPISVCAVFEDFGNNRVLASTGPRLTFVNNENGTAYPVALANALSGVDLAPPTQPAPPDCRDDESYDVLVRFNSSAPGRYTGTDLPGPDEIDFSTLALHELAHGLGVLGTARVVDGVGQYSDPPLVYDRSTVAGGRPVLERPSGSDELTRVLQGGGVRWGGDRGTVAAGGTSPRLYAPSTWQPGSSYSHLDETTFPRGDQDSLMTPEIADQEVVRDPGPIERGVLSDMGWAVARVPVQVRDTRASCPSGSVPPDGFGDVDGDVHRPSIACMRWWGVALGRTATAYDPFAPVTRDAMASFVARAVLADGGSLPDAPPDAFDDDNGSSHELEINQLAAVGIVSGTGPRTYSPRNQVTRGQMARFLAGAYAQRTGTALQGGNDYFADDDGNLFEADIDRIAAVGYTGGKQDGIYDPAAAVQRDQMASFLARLLDHLVQSGYGAPPAT